MKILLLGATGRTGKLVIEEAIRRGHKISAIAHNPEILKDFQIDITKGTPYDFETVEKALSGCEAVINTLNISRKSDNPWAGLASPRDLISKSASNVVSAIKKADINRFIALSTIGAGSSWKTTPAILKFIVSVSNLKYAFRDHSKQEEILQNSSVEYTICRAPMLSTETNTKGAVGVKEGENPPKMVLSRNSAAEFFIKILENKEHIREIVNLSNNSD
jgi:putative NADH-flavin reductase